MSPFPRAVLRAAAGWLAAAAVGVAAPRAQTTTCASNAAGGGPSDGDSRSALLSADGRRVVFTSTATNLVAGDTNGGQDVFVRDLATGVTSRASVSSLGAEANGASHRPAISADGRFVAFGSEASNLVAGDTNGAGDVFVRELSTGVTTRVSVSSSGAQADGNGFRPSLSADGRFVAFASDATNLVAGDQNLARDVFVHDRATGTTSRASVGPFGLEADGASSGPVLSADGTRVLFSSDASNLGAADANGTWDVFVRDLAGSTTSCASLAPSGASGNGASFAFALSADGASLAFWSQASDLVAGDGNGCADAFVRALAGGPAERVSVSSGGVEADLGCFDPTLSADGRFVAFVGSATNLDGPDVNGVDDVFLRDRLSGTTTRLSLDLSGGDGDGASREPSVAADGRAIAFWSEATDLFAGDSNAQPDVLVHQRGDAAAFTSFCAGDASACPCANGGLAGHGCENSVATGGALLAGTGVASLASDTARLDASGMTPAGLAIALQGDVAVAPTAFGDGVRCAGGALLRLFVAGASAGAASFPPPSGPPLSTRSAELGDPLTPGATRVHQVYYRDPAPGFCSTPAGGTFNASNAVAICWGN